VLGLGDEEEGGLLLKKKKGGVQEGKGGLARTLGKGLS